MEIRTIATFLKVASTQNFSKAAQQLGYSQSAVTVQIQKLESELNVPLFDRIGKRAFLTENGKNFIPYANELMRAYNSALSFSSDTESLVGALRIGGVESVCTAILPQLLPKFYRLCPNVKVIIKSNITEELIKMAENNELDLIFTLDEKIYRSDTVCVAEKKEETVLVTLNSPETQPNKIIPLNSLCHKPFVLTETKAPYTHALERVLSERNLEIKPILEIGNTETIIHLLKKGIGISFLPKFTVKDELKKQKLIQLSSDFDSVYMYLQLMRHKSKWLTPQMKVFISLVEEYLSK